MQQASQAISPDGKFSGGAAAEPLFSLYHSCSKHQFTSMGSKLAPHSHSHRPRRWSIAKVNQNHRQCSHIISPVPALPTPAPVPPVAANKFNFVGFFPCFQEKCSPKYSLYCSSSFIPFDLCASDQVYQLLVGLQRGV